MVKHINKKGNALCTAKYVTCCCLPNTLTACYMDSLHFVKAQSMLTLLTLNSYLQNYVNVYVLHLEGVSEISMWIVLQLFLVIF